MKPAKLAACPRESNRLRYFGQLYTWAQQLVRAGKAYVCDLSADEIRKYRGTLTEPGKDSPYHDRSIEENLDLFARMRKGEFPDGTRVLRTIALERISASSRRSVLPRIAYRLLAG